VYSAKSRGRRERRYLHAPERASARGPIGRLVGFLEKLPADKAWRVSVVELRKGGVAHRIATYGESAYPAILEGGGEALAGWEAADLHEFFLGEHFGWETLEGLGRKRLRPLRRSAKLSTLEFSDFVGLFRSSCGVRGLPFQTQTRGRCE